MGNYYSVHTQDVLNGIDGSTEKEEIQEFVDVQPNFDPNEIFHPSAFDSPRKKITDSQYTKVIHFSKNNKYVRCHFCGYLTPFCIVTKGGRFTYPHRDTITIIKNENTHEDIMCIECNHCDYDIEVKI